MRLEFDSNGYVCTVVFGCETGSCTEYTGIVPQEPEEYSSYADWADRAQIQAYYLNNSGNLAYDAVRAAKLPAEDEVEEQRYTPEKVKALGIIDVIYPVGSIYMSVNDVDPANLFGGTWERIEDKFILASGSTYEAGTSGGAESHKHIAPIGYQSSSQYLGTLNINGTTTTFPKEGGYNTVKRSTGGSSIPSGIAAYYTDEASNIPPYMAVYVWRRVEDVIPDNYQYFIDSMGNTLLDKNANEFIVEVK